MPELPDVEGFRRYLARHAEGHRIVRVEAPDQALIRNSTPSVLGRALKGRPFGHPQRHGKWLIAPAGEVELLIHFGMTGFLRWSPAGAKRGGHGSEASRPGAGEGPRRVPSDARHRDRSDARHPDSSDARDPHDRVIFDCEDGELRYNNMRRFGGLWLARDERERDSITGPLGPDAAALEQPAFDQLLSNHRGAIKAALMDQRLIAGVGNLLSDEILWRARVHPATPVAKLGSRQRSCLYEALHATVSESIRYGRVPHGKRWLTRVRDDREARCPRCGTTLQRATIAGRTACWCPREQRHSGSRELRHALAPSIVFDQRTTPNTGRRPASPLLCSIA